MKVFGTAGFFIVGAALTYSGFVWKEATGRWRLFAAGFAAFGLAIVSGKVPFLLALFALTTGGFVYECSRGRIRAAVAGGLATSDLLLAAAITLYHLQTTRWDLPLPGQWGAATPLIAAAAAVRFSGFISEDALDATGAASLAWWQGALLAWWTGPSPALIAVGMAVALASLLAKGPQAGFLLAGGLACVLAGTGAPALSVVVAGAAASAFVLGERLLPMWVLAALPLSLVSVVEVREVSRWAAAGLAAAVAGVAVAATKVSAPGAWGGRLTAGAAFAAAAFSMSHDVEWWIYGLGAAAGLTLLTTRPEDVPLAALPVEGLSGAHAPPQGRGEVLVFTAWVLLGVVALLTVRLLILGGRTGFL